MKYDKKSFLTGLAVGRQLKGWASVGGSGGGSSDEVNHTFPKAVVLRIPNILPVQSFGHPLVRAITMKVPNIITVNSYEGSE